MAPHTRHLRLRGALLLCALSGALLALAFPGPGWWPLAWVALVPWIIVLRQATGPGAALGSWLGGSTFLGILLSWLWLFGWTIWALASVSLGLAFLVWGLCCRWIGRLGPASRVLGAAVLWCGMEWARGLGRFGFTWGWLGYSQSPAADVLPVARLAGTLGISFLVALVNAALAEAVVGAMRRERPLRLIGRTVLALAAVAGAVVGASLWAARAGELDGPVIRAAVIQGSAHGPLRADQVNAPVTPEERARTRETYTALTAEAARERPVLVVWPESVLTADPDVDPAVAEWVARAARVSGGWLLVGGPRQDVDGRQFNSAFLYTPTGNQVARYDKVQLVPFGEYVPARDRLPFLDRYEVRTQDFRAGSVHRVLQAGIVAIGPMICFESIFPGIAWELTHRDAQVLVVITNDAWFGRTAAAAQHRQIAVLRAVETNRWVLRAASTGISSIISPEGKVVAEAGLFEQAALVHDVALASPGPRRRAASSLFPWAVVFLSVACLVAPAALPRRKAARARRRAPRPQPPGRASSR